MPSRRSLSFLSTFDSSETAIIYLVLKFGHFPFPNMVEKLAVEELDYGRGCSIDAPEAIMPAQKTDVLSAQHTYYEVNDVHAPQLSEEHSK